MRVLGNFILVVILLATPTLADDTATANRLLVEAAELIQSADRVPSEQRLGLLRMAQDNLQKIIQLYPSTELAVKLSTGQSIGYVSLAKVDDAVKVEKEACWGSPAWACVIVLAVDAAGEIDTHPFYGARRAQVLARIASAQAKSGDIAGSKRTLDQAIKAGKAFNDIPGNLYPTVYRFRSVTHDVSIVSAFVDIYLSDNTGSRTGTILSARKFAKEINNGDDRNLALAQIALSQKVAGDHLRAEETFTEVSTIGGVPWTLENLASVLEYKKWEVIIQILRVGGAPKMLATLQTTDATTRKVFAQALSYAERTDYALYRVQEFANLASLQAIIGDVTGAKETIHKAVVAAGHVAADVRSVGRSIGRPVDNEAVETARAEAFAHIVSAQVAAGDIKAGVATAQKIGRAEYLAEALAVIAFDLAGSVH